VKRLKKHLTPATVISCIALFVALSGSVYAAGLAKNSVKAKNIAKGAVTNPKLKNGAVTAKKLANGAVIGSKLANESVGASKLTDASVRSNALGGGVVTSPKLKDLAVTQAKLANASVGKDQLGASAVETGKIAKEAVTAEKLAAGFYNQLAKNVSFEKIAAATESTVTPQGNTVPCPAGKVAISGGARIVSTDIDNVDTVAITQSAPSFNAQNVATGWFVQARAIAPETTPWSIEVHAICAEL
jgi:hypothetical protein